ncbi:MAG: VOC family protein [Anaerolineaceae bacterium]|nr:VOC family protein [Anaerolineaceae bacterium]
MTKPMIGRIMWTDLTVPNADAIRDFYQAVVGWEASGVPIDAEYEDYNMLPPGGEPAAGICHARGVNANIPPQWLIYITVADIDQSIAACTRLGGKVIVPLREQGGSRFCVIQDPAGAVAALYQPAAE